MSESQAELASVEPTTPGVMLRKERERQGRTIQEIATEMHLGTHMIEALEADQLAVLGAPVFARGHLRKYALLLGLPVERVHELYLKLTDRPRDPDHVPVLHKESEPSIPMSPDSKDRRAQLLSQPKTLALAVGTVAVLGFISWWLMGRHHEESAPAVEASAVASDDVPAEPAPAPVEQLGPSATPLVSSAQQASATPAASQPATPQSSNANAAVAAAKPARGKVRLRFNFSQESWVEVYDARGNRMLYDVGQPGQSRGVDVDAPAQVVLGLANGVATEANGREVAVPPRRVSSQVARFTVNADGSVQ